MQTYYLSIYIWIEFRQYLNFRERFGIVVVVSSKIYMRGDLMPILMYMLHNLRIRATENIVERRTKQHEVSSLYSLFVLFTSHFQSWTKTQIDVMPEYHEGVPLRQARVDLLKPTKGVARVFEH